MDKINWELYNRIYRDDLCSLCVGEEKTMTPSEIRIINETLETMRDLHFLVKRRFILAGERFKIVQSNKP